MNYTVLYAREAEQQLIDLWLAADPRGDVARASDEIDSRLGTNPWGEGESRGSGLRILIVLPLAAFYQVSDDDRIVRVVEIRNVPGRQ